MRLTGFSAYSGPFGLGAAIGEGYVITDVVYALFLYVSVNR